jgi:hypothetical protein
MDKVTGKNRTDLSNVSQSKNQSNPTNEVSSKEKKPVLSEVTDRISLSKIKSVVNRGKN